MRRQQNGVEIQQLFDARTSIVKESPRFLAHPVLPRRRNAGGLDSNSDSDKADLDLLYAVDDDFRDLRRFDVVDDVEDPPPPISRRLLFSSCKTHVCG